jgi:RimJ/RimL family protein N-acetyltransferase
MHKLMLSLPERLATRHLVLRPYKAGDGQAYFDVCQRNLDHLLPYEAGNPALHVKSVQDAEILVREFALDWAARQAFFFGAWALSTNDFVAQVYVGPVNWELPEFEIGYFVDCLHQGKGFMTEAIHAVLDFCFVHLHAHRLRIGCNETNIRSWRLAERCGFRREGHIRQQHAHIRCDDGSYSGDYLYGLLRSEYMKD